MLQGKQTYRHPDVNVWTDILNLVRKFLKDKYNTIMHVPGLAPECFRVSRHIDAQMKAFGLIS